MSVLVLRVNACPVAQPWRAASLLARNKVLPAADCTAVFQQQNI
jgi:hypothetical protein